VDESSNTLSLISTFIGLIRTVWIGSALIQKRKPIDVLSS
jgi:hypothetical protein